MKLAKKIQEIIASFYEQYSEHKIIIIANTQRETRAHKDFELDFANEIEFFTDAEFDEISILGFRPIKNFTKYYFHETDFMQDILSKKLPNKKIIVFNMARNGKTQGKKSLIPSFCDLLNIPYTGSNAFVQSLCRNKYVYTHFLKAHNITMPITFALDCNNTWIPYKPPTKFIIKPIAECGSLGVSQTNDFYDDLKIQNLHFVNDNHMLFQEYIDSDEYEVPVLVIKNQVIPLTPMKIVCKQKILDELTSSTNNFSYEFLNDSYKLASKLQEIAVKVVSLLGIENYGRVDFRINSQQEPVIIDISTTPFLSKHSSFYENFIKMGLNYTNLFELITALALTK